MTGNASVQASRKKSEIRLVRMIAMAVAAFVLSWSPYCFVSVIATIRDTTVLTPGEAEVPDLLAKASVIYNPIVYTIMNDRFRRTLLRLIQCSRCRLVGDVSPAADSSSRPESEQEKNSHSARRAANKQRESNI